MALWPPEQWPGFYLPLHTGLGDLAHLYTGLFILAISYWHANSISLPVSCLLTRRYLPVAIWASCYMGAYAWSHGPLLLSVIPTFLPVWHDLAFRLAAVAAVAVPQLEPV